MREIELVVDARARLGEGPLWDEAAGVLWWVNIIDGQVRRFDPSSGQDQSYEIGQMVGTVVVRESGGLMLALESGFAAFDPATGRLEPFCDPESDKPDQRFNDGKCDPGGRFWAGTMQKVERNPVGALYCLELDGQCHRRLEKVTVSNGIVWTADQKTMYYIDSPTRRVDAFDFDPTEGSLANRRTAVQVPEGIGNPDGMAIDSDDNIWVALWGGAAVVQFDPRSGDLLDKIEVPSRNVTACAFGGPDLKQLYITTARDRVSDDELVRLPQSGGLFRIALDVTGTTTFRYRG